MSLYVHIDDCVIISPLTSTFYSGIYKNTIILVLYALVHFLSDNFVNLDMDALLTNEQKLDFARREFEKVKDANQSITWENSCMLQSLTIDRIFDLFVLASILKTIFGNLSETKLNDLFYDADKDGEFIFLRLVLMHALINVILVMTKILLDDLCKS